MVQSFEKITLQHLGIVHLARSIHNKAHFKRSFLNSLKNVG